MNKLKFEFLILTSIFFISCSSSTTRTNTSSGLNGHFTIIRQANYIRSILEQAQLQRSVTQQDRMCYPTEEFLLWQRMV